MRWRVLVVGLIWVAAIVRFSTAWRHDDLGADNGAAVEPDLTNAAAYCFDPDAPVLLGVGADAAPGIAGEDDNRNGVIDERRELGAVGSDDVCLAPHDFGYASVQQHPDTFVISRGAFAACPEAGGADRFLIEGFGWVVR